MPSPRVSPAPSGSPSEPGRNGTPRLAPIGSSRSSGLGVSSTDLNGSGSGTARASARPGGSPGDTSRSRASARPNSRSSARPNGRPAGGGSRAAVRPMGSDRLQLLQHERGMSAKELASLGYKVEAQRKGEAHRAAAPRGKNHVHRIYTKDAPITSLHRQALEGPRAGGAASSTAKDSASVASTDSKEDPDEDPEVRAKRKRREAIRKKLAKQRANQGCWAAVKRAFTTEKNVPLGAVAYEAATKVFLVPADIRRLKFLFDELDIDGNRDIDVDDLLDHIEEPYGPFQYGIMRIIGKDAMKNVHEDEVVPDLAPKKKFMDDDDEEEEASAGAGADPGAGGGAEGGGIIKRVKKGKKGDLELVESTRLDFDEFVTLLCRFAMYTKDDILEFCFRTFDRDNSGTIDEQEFIDMAKWLNTQTPVFPGNFRTAMEEFDVDDDGCLSKTEFKALYKRFPLVLFPAFRCQESLQKACMGEDFWKLVGEDVMRDRKIREWRKTHGGAYPKEPRAEKWARQRNGRHNLYSGKPSLPPSDKPKAPRKKGVKMAKKKKKK